MRSRFPAVAVGLIALVAGCSPAARDPSATRSRPSPTPTEGGACYLLNPADIEKALGVRFDVAAASRSKSTYTCVVQPALTGHPDLSLSVTATTADASVFEDTVAPRGATSVSGLGRAGYRTTLKASAGNGPAVEVGWLSGDGRLLTLRFTLAADGSAAEQAAAAKAATPKVVALAKQIDRSRV